MEEKQLQNEKMSYRQFVSKLKVLSMRAEYNGEKAEAEHYKDIYKKMEKLQERIHLPLVGEETEEKIAYNEILRVLGNKTQERKDTDEEVLSTIKEVEKLCEKHNIQYENTEKTKKEIQR